MTDIYKICIFIGLYLLTFTIGIGSSYCHLKKEGFVSSVSLGLRNSSIIMGVISAVLLSIGIYIYNFVI